MPNRFDTDSHFTIPAGVKSTLRLLFLVLIVGIFLYALHVFGRQTILRQEESLENAINRNIIQCYALEGAYPPSLSYIEEHYGLTYDHSTFYVDYRPIADNLYPDVTIMQIRSKGP